MPLHCVYHRCVALKVSSKDFQAIASFHSKGPLDEQRWRDDEPDAGEVVGRMSFDADLSNDVAAALQAAGDIAYLWSLEEDSLEWSGRLADAGIDFASELSNGRSFA